MKNKLYVLEGTTSSPKDNYASPMMKYNPLLYRVAQKKVIINYLSSFKTAV